MPTMLTIGLLISQISVFIIPARGFKNLGISIYTRQ